MAGRSRALPDPQISGYFRFLVQQACALENWLWSCITITRKYWITYCKVKCYQNGSCGNVTTPPWYKHKSFTDGLETGAQASICSASWRPLAEKCVKIYTENGLFCGYYREQLIEMKSGQREGRHVENGLRPEAKRGAPPHQETPALFLKVSSEYIESNPD